MAKVFSPLIKLLWDASTSRAEKNVRRLGEGIKSVGDKAESSAKISSFALVSIGTALTSAATATGFMAARMEDSLVRLESAFERVGTSADYVVGELDRLDVATPMFARIAGAAAKFGVSGEENLGLFAKTARQMGLIVGENSEKVGKSLVELGATLQIGAVRIRGLGSAMIALERRFPVTIEGMTRLLQTTGALARSVGIGEEALLGMNAVLSEQGLTAQEAGGLVNTLVEQFHVLRGQGVGLSGVFQMVGGSFAEWQAMRPEDQMLAFVESLGKLDPVSASAAMDAIGISNLNLQQKILASTRSVDGMREAIARSADEIESQRAIQDEWNRMMRALTPSINELWFQTKQLAISTGRALLPVFKLGVDLLLSLVKVLKDIPAPIRAFGVAFAAVVGVMVIINAAVVPAIAGFLGLATAAGAATVAAAPWILIGAAIAAAVWGLWEAGKALSGWLGGLEGESRNAARALVAFIPIIGPIVAAYDLWREHGDAITAHLSELWGWVTDTVGAIREFGSAIWGALFAPADEADAALQRVTDATSALRDQFLSLFSLPSFQSIVDAIQRAGRGILFLMNPVNLLNMAWERMSKFMASAEMIFRDMNYIIKEIASRFLAIGQSILRGVVQPTREFRDFLFDIGKTLWTPFKKVKEVVDLLIDSIKKLPQAALDATLALADIPLPLVGSVGSLLPGVGVASPLIKAQRQMVAQLNAAPRVRGASPPAPGVSATQIGGTTSAEGGGGVTSRLVTPISIEIDGLVLGRALAEHVVEVGRERAYSEPVSAMRGVEP